MITPQIEVLFRKIFLILGIVIVIFIPVLFGFYFYHKGDSECIKKLDNVFLTIIMITCISLFGLFVAFVSKDIMLYSIVTLILSITIGFGMIIYVSLLETIPESVMEKSIDKNNIHSYFLYIGCFICLIGFAISSSYMFIYFNNKNEERQLEADKKLNPEFYKRNPDL